MAMTLQIKKKKKKKKEDNNKVAPRRHCDQ